MIRRLRTALPTCEWKRRHRQHPGLPKMDCLHQLHGALSPEPNGPIFGSSDVVHARWIDLRESMKLARDSAHAFSPLTWYSET